MGYDTRIADLEGALAEAIRTMRMYDLETADLEAVLGKPFAKVAKENGEEVGGGQHD